MTQTYEMTMKHASPLEEEVSHDRGYSDDPQPSCSDGGSDEHGFGGLWLIGPRSWPLYDANLVCYLEYSMDAIDLQHLDYSCKTISQTSFRTAGHCTLHGFKRWLLQNLASIPPDGG
jgi:hypothetical protein